MTDDIVERLRTDVLWHERRGNGTIAADCRDAADEIERLRADLAQAMAERGKALAVGDGLEQENERLRAALAAQQASAPVIGHINPAPHAAAPLVNSTVAYVNLTPGTAAQQAPQAPPPTAEAAHAMGARGGPVVEAERLAFEAWMRGHCWALCATWTGTQYRSDDEAAGNVNPHAMRTRQLWAAWRDRAALAAPAAPAGWQLVPVEPTLKQMAAMGQAIRACYGLDGVDGDVTGVYRAMLAAAPTHTGDAPETMTRG